VQTNCNQFNTHKISDETYC